MSRISDLEGRLTLMKLQAKTALDKANKSCGLMKQISVLEDKVSGLVPESYILRNATPFLLVSLSPFVRCCDVRFLETPLFLWLCFCKLIFFRASGTCLDFVGEARQVSE
jgi:hypothetical protein